MRTPNLPGFFWGNFLLFAKPPTSGDFDRWRERFKSEVGDQPGVEHEAFGWDSPSGAMGDVESFKSAGFVPFSSAVMTADHVSPSPHLNFDVVTRPVTTADEWDAAALCEANYTSDSTPNHRIEARIASYRGMSRTDSGEWYGAFLEGRIVGGLGIYKVDETGVIEAVSTHPDFRRRGIGRSAVYQATRHAMENLGIRELLLIADDEGDAKRMYEQLGFRTVEMQVGMLRT